MKTDSSAYYWTAAAAALVAAVLLVILGLRGGEIGPDKVSLAVLPAIIAGAVVAHFKARKRNVLYRGAAVIALAAALVLFWLIGAVGILGSDQHHRADLLYISVPTAGTIGAILARFQSRGMARALYATALVQMMIPVLALVARMYRSPVSSGMSGIMGTFLLNGFFAVLFLVSAILFARAGRLDGGLQEKLQEKQYSSQAGL